MAPQQLQSIFIRSHQTRTEPDQHVVYQVEAHDVNSRSWSVWRRYSEFVELDAELAKEAAQSPPISLPPKQRSWKPWSKGTTMDEAYIAERSDGLERYLRTLLSHRDSRWRDARAFADFLAAPLVTNKHAAPPDGFTTSSWLDEQERLVALARDVRADLSKRDALTAKGDVTARQVSVDAKRKLATLITRMAGLTKGLDSLGMGGMAEGELRRRSDMVSRLQDEAETLGKLAMASRNAATAGAASRAAASASLTAAPPTPERTSLLGSAAGPRPGRVLGSRKPPGETEQTRPLDNAGLVGLQQTMLTDQDARVEQISAVVRRQRELGLAIGAELAMHNELLDGLSADVDKTQDKLDGAKGQLKKLGS